MEPIDSLAIRLVGKVHVTHYIPGEAHAFDFSYPLVYVWNHRKEKIAVGPHYVV